MLFLRKEGIGMRLIDADKVVEQLERAASDTESYCLERIRKGKCDEYSTCNCCVLHEAIEIVKHGGRECGYCRQDTVLKDGKLHDSIWFEIMAEEFKKRRKGMTGEQKIERLKRFSSWNVQDDRWLDNDEIELLKTMYPKTCKMVDGRLGWLDDHECEEGKAIDSAIKALETIVELKKRKITLSDLENYMQFEDECVKKGFTFKSLIEAREKQELKKPIYEGDGYDPEGNIIFDEWMCPCCDARYEVDYDEYDFCPNCGQKLDWSEGENEPNQSTE